MSIRDISKLHPNVVFRNKFRSVFPYKKLKPVSKDIFPNQEQFGADIFKAFSDRSVHTVMALALTQSGKTGSMLAVINQFVSSDMSIPLDHIFVITGHSSSDWLSQTKQRFPPSISNNIFHRNTLSNFSKKAALLTNIIIFIDETQIASLNSQSVQFALLKAGISSESIYYRDIKFVLVSATPDSSIKRFIPKRVGYDIVYMTPAPGYVSAFSLLESGQVLPAKDICGFNRSNGTFSPFALDNIREINIGLIPKYHIIRTHHSFMHTHTIDNFRTVFGNKCRYLSNPHLNILSIKPGVHTFIFIKETLRCANTVVKDHLGVLYERVSKYSKVSSIIQGLLGRATGYHKFSFTIYSNISSILLYKSLWDTQFFDHPFKASSWDF